MWSQIFTRGVGMAFESAKNVNKIDIVGPKKKLKNSDSQN